MTSVDHRLAQSPVRNQGPRSSCVAFAVTSAHEWISSVTARSTEDALWAAHQIGGAADQEATWVDFALAGLERHGHAAESAWPYGDPAFPAIRPLPVGDLDLQVLPPWRHLSSTSTFQGVVDLVTDGAAVILTLEHNSRAWLAASDTGVIDAPAGSKTVGRHAVLTVGADSGASEPSLIIKNSWGTHWGDDGYARLTRAYFENFIAEMHVLGGLDSHDPE